MILPRSLSALVLALVASSCAVAADDAYGDPLPEGAKLRLGTARMRTAYTNSPTVLTPDGKFLVAHSPIRGLQYMDPATGKTAKEVKVAGNFGSVVAFSADGRRAAANGFQTAVVLDLESGKVAATVTRNYGFGDHGLSLSADGKTLALGGIMQNKDRATAVVWDVDANKAIATVTPVQNQTVSVALSPDGKRLATWGQYFDAEAKGPPDEAADPSHMFQLWDARTGKELGKARLTNVFALAAVVFSTDGSTVAASGGNGQVYLFDAATGGAKGLLLGRAGMGRKLTFSPDGKILAAGGDDGAVQQWAIPDGKRLSVTVPPVPMTNGLRAIQFVDAAHLVAWGGRGVVTIVWDVPSGKLISPAGGHFGNITGVAVPAGGKELLTAAADGQVLRWDSHTGKQLGSLPLKPPAIGYGSSVTFGSISLSADGTVAMTREGIGSQGVFDLAGGQQLFVFPAENNRTAILTLSPDGRRAIEVFTSFDAKKYPPKVVVWDVPTGTRLGGVDFPAMSQDVSGAAVTPDGKTLVTIGVKQTDKGRGDFVATGWVLATGKKLGEYTEPSEYGTGFVVAAADSQSAFVATTKRKLLQINLTSGKVEKEFKTGGMGPAAAPALSPDGKLLAVALPPGFGPNAAAKVLLIDVAGGQVKKTLTGPASNPTLVAFSPDGKQLFVGASDTTVLMWDLSGE